MVNIARRAHIAKPRTDHLVHLGFLGTLLISALVTMAISAAFLAGEKGQYPGTCFVDASSVGLTSSGRQLLDCSSTRPFRECVERRCNRRIVSQA
jgi:hypothetical protein